MKSKSHRNQVRIIGGKWRGRKITFPEMAELRPTPDRVRETLFNWLAPALVGARCLDLFAGSGVLGFEALSRGAASTVFIEKDRDTAENLRNNARALALDPLTLIETDALQWLTRQDSPFDIVFVDPPYQKRSLAQCFALLENKGWLKENVLIYFESDVPVPVTELPSTWTLLREKKAGHIYYYLAKK